MKFSIASSAISATPSKPKASDAWVCFQAIGGKATAPGLESLLTSAAKTGDFSGAKA